MSCRVREKTPPEVKEQRERERELKELDRDTRTVFAYNLNLKAEERDLFEFFSKAGKVVDVKIIMDRNTRKSKGFSYIEFQNRVCPCSSGHTKIAHGQAPTGALRAMLDSRPQPSGMSPVFILPRLADRHACRIYARNLAERLCCIERPSALHLLQKMHYRCGFALPCFAAEAA